jgi:hypothetical protein
VKQLPTKYIETALILSLITGLVIWFGGGALINWVAEPITPETVRRLIVFAGVIIRISLILHWCGVWHKASEDAYAKARKDADIISDGFGGEWSAICPVCGRRSMSVVRPGKVQCEYCG